MENPTNCKYSTNKKLIDLTVFSYDLKQLEEEWLNEGDSFGTSTHNHCRIVIFLRYHEQKPCYES